MIKPTVLLTNDDGIDAPGLRHLWSALHEICDLYICAPASEKSGMGPAVTLKKPLHVIPVDWAPCTPAWKVTGTPADCVRMATNITLEKKPDLIVSGINRGANSGRNILFSGTVGGVIDGVLRGIPGIAVSCEDFKNPQYKYFEPYIASLVHYILAHPLETGSFLNVNFPCGFKDKHKGLRLARQGMGYYIESPAENSHPDGWSYYWMGGKWLDMEEEEESDVHLLKQGYITAVPLHVQDLTAHATFKARKEQFQKHFNETFT